MKSTLAFYWAVLLRRIHYFLLIAILISAASLTLARILPPVYVAQTSLLVEPPTISDGGGLQEGAVEALQRIEEGLMTRVNLLSVAREMDIFKGANAMTADAIVDGMRGNTAVSYSAGRGEATIFDLQFSSGTGEQAANVVNRFVTIILQNDASRRTGVAGENLDFYEGEVEQLDQKLADRNAALLAFNTQNSDAMPDTLDYRLSQQSLLLERLNSAEIQIRGLNDEKKRLVALFETTGRVGAGSTPEQQQLALLQDSLLAALAVYSAEHPKVKLIEAQIAQQEVVVGRQVSTSGGTNNGASSILDINLADIDARIKLLTTQSGQINEQLLVLADTIQRTPANTIRLGELLREQASIQRQYDAAIGKLSSAAATERIELLAKGQRIIVLDPATVPSNPSSPNRFLIAAGGTFLGIAMGLGLVALLEILNSAIRRPTDITRALGITPIATVPYIRTPMELVMRRAGFVFAFALVIFGVPATLYGIHTYYMPLDLLYDRLAGKIGGIIGIG